MSVIGVCLVATAGALCGAYVNYYLSLWIGRPLVYRFADSRIGHACLLDRAKVVRAESYFDKHGAISTFIGRLIPAIRQLISIPAGLSRMNIGVFTLFTILGAGVWNTILTALGWWLGRACLAMFYLKNRALQQLSYVCRGGHIACMCGFHCIQCMQAQGKQDPTAKIVLDGTAAQYNKNQYDSISLVTFCRFRQP